MMTRLLTAEIAETAEKNQREEREKKRKQPRSARSHLFSYFLLLCSLIFLRGLCVLCGEKKEPIV
jgi:hypothetical protein